VTSIGSRPRLAVCIQSRVGGYTRAIAHVLRAALSRLSLSIAPWACAAVAFIAVFCSHDGVAAVRSASEVKAAYLFKFSSYVQWPESAFASADNTATFCIVGEDPFGGVLEDTLQGREINTRPIKIRRLSTVSKSSDCLVLYIGDVSPQQASQALTAVQGSGVLTVTDAASLDEATGIINFVTRDNSIRFSINEEAATRNGLVISSKLLSLSVSKGGQ